MPAKWIKFGDPPPTPGGDVELLVAKRLADELPEGYLVLSSLSLPTRGSGYFYEIDLVVVSPFLCDLLDVKHVFPAVIVVEDGLLVEGGREFDGVFSVLDNKGRVLNGRFRDPGKQGIVCPFDGDVRIGTRVVVGPDCQEIRFDYPEHKAHRKALTLAEAVAHYTDHFQQEAAALLPAMLKRVAWEQEKGWRDFAQKRGRLRGATASAGSAASAPSLPGAFSASTRRRTSRPAR